MSKVNKFGTSCEFHEVLSTHVENKDESCDVNDRGVDGAVWMVWHQSCERTCDCR